jgi:hypothetical protein
MDLTHLVNQTVTLQGTAENAHSGGVVLCDDKPVYVDGVAWWDQTTGQRIEVTGLLVEAELAPDPQEENGLVSHGVTGTNLVLRDATWRVLPPV